MLPILYSYRRCPYAMRARMALQLADIAVEIREISLRDKPAHMLQISPKATVPVLQLANGTVIDESLEIMLWALKDHALQPQGLSPQNISAEADYSCVKPSIHAPSRALILENDTGFKKALDAYKYPERHPNQTQTQHRADGEVFLQKLEHMLNLHTYLLSDEAGLADIAIFPFVRQFASVDDAWWQTKPYPKLAAWLSRWVESALFNSIMIKNPTYQAKDSVG
jgi:glutathione S-transferase